MSKRGILWLSAIGVLFLAGWMESSERERPGKMVEVEDIYTARRADLGRGMFLIRWRPDKGRAFNSVACRDCHDQPSIGGSNHKQENRVMMVADPESASGTRNFQRNQPNGDGQMRRVPFPDHAELRRAPNLYGLGFIDAISEATLTGLADPADKNADGISGRSLKIDGQIGRFGWKGSVSSLEKFVYEAYQVELGMLPFNLETNPNGQIDEGQIDATVLYVRVLEPPKPDPSIEKMAASQATFAKIGCASCHTPELRTAKSSIPELANKVIHPYSDFLLHEMSDGALHAAPKQPSKSEFRTPPLWGLGATSGPYWHDSSAVTLEAAIQKHGGEAAKSRDSYNALPADAKEELINFLNAL